MRRFECERPRPKGLFLWYRVEIHMNSWASLKSLQWLIFGGMCSIWFLRSNGNMQRLLSNPKKILRFTSQSLTLVLGKVSSQKKVARKFSIIKHLFKLISFELVDWRKYANSKSLHSCQLNGFNRNDHVNKSRESPFYSKTQSSSNSKIICVFHEECLCVVFN